MMNTLRTNTQALTSQNALRFHNQRAVEHMHQMSSGTKISARGANSLNYIQSNTASANIRSLEMGLRNVNQTTSLIQAIDSTAGVIQDTLMDMKEKTIFID